MDTGTSTGTGTGTALLQARGVAKSFGGVPALRNGCLELQAGSVHALAIHAAAPGEGGV